MYLIDGNKNVFNDGKALLFTIDEFSKRLCGIKERCFVCGRSSGVRNFNEEHIIPKWILKKFNIYNKLITLPNGTRIRYNIYKTPCCKECNSIMGDFFEKPIRDNFEKGFKGFAKHLNSSRNKRRLFTWICLLYSKIVIKDSRLILNRSEGGGVVSDLYSIEEMHHVYCMARSFYSGADWVVIDSNFFHEVPSEMGTLIVLRAKKTSDDQAFDFSTNLIGRSLMIRVGDIVILSVLNDCGVTGIRMKPLLKKITGGLSPIQIKELFCIMSCISASIENRPIFKSFTSKEGHIMGAFIDSDVHFKPTDPKVFGEMLYKNYLPVISRLGAKRFFGELYGEKRMYDCDINLFTKLFEKRLVNGEISFIKKNDGSFRKGLRF